MDLSVNLKGLSLKNPVLAASGVFGYGEEYVRVGDINWFGAVCIKGTTLRPRAGNSPPRIRETPSGLLNSIGLENPGVKEVVEKKIPFLLKYNVPIIANIAGDTYDEFYQLASAFEGSGVSAVEVNISCPNVRSGGMAFGVDPRSSWAATRAVRRGFNGPVIVKLTPNAQNVPAIAKAAAEGGADIISLVNTYLGMAIDIKAKRPFLGQITGGLSGPAIKPMALNCVYQVSQAVSLPVIGMGGIFGAEDALEFMMAGASAVALGTVLLVNPLAPRDILEGLKTYGEKENLTSIKDLVGAAWSETSRSSFDHS